MKVLLDARTGRKPTGIGNYVGSLTRALADVAPEKVVPVCSRRDVRRLKRLGLMPWVASRGVAPDDLPPADVIHGPNFHALPHRTARRVATIHDVGFLSLPECHPPGMPERLDRLVRASLDETERFICVSDHTRRTFIEAYGVSPERAVTVPLGVDAERFGTANVRPLPRRFGRRPYLLFVGALIPRKDVLTLLEAFERIATEHGSLRLIIAGNKTRRWASDWPRVKQWLTAHRRLARRIAIPNYVPDSHLPALYREAAALAVPSLLEGFGMTILEGMAAGCPVVATRVGALPETGGDGVYFAKARDADSLADALLAALHGDDRDRRVAAARDVVATHTWARTAERTLEVYASVA